MALYRGTRRRYSLHTEDEHVLFTLKNIRSHTQGIYSLHTEDEHVFTLKNIRFMHRLIRRGHKKDAFYSYYLPVNRSTVVRHIAFSVTGL